MTEIYKVEMPTEGVQIFYSREPSDASRLERVASDMFDVVVILIVMIPILYLIGIWLRHRADKVYTDAVIKQGYAEAELQSELRRAREAEKPA